MYLYLEYYQMSEIPKDLRAYICWHRTYGHCPISWCGSSYFVYGVEAKLRDVTRFMDEMGVWHEIEQDKDK